jgi:hypothetical protein
MNMTDEKIYDLIARGWDDNYICEQYLKDTITQYTYYTPIGSDYDISPLLKTIEEKGFTMLLENVRVNDVEYRYDEGLLWKFQKGLIVLNAMILVRNNPFQRVIYVHFFYEKKNLYKCTWNIKPSELKDHLSMWADAIESRILQIEDFKHHCALMRKKYEISQKSIDALIKTQLHDSGYPYSMRQDEAKMLLKIKLKYGRQIEINSSPFNFQKNLVGLIDKVKKIEELMNSFRSMSVKVTYQNPIENWIKGEENMQ